MKGYYEQKLSARRLKKVYEIARPRVLQYFSAELSHVLEKIKPGHKVLDLGCGFGRILPELAQKAGSVIGIDNSEASLLLAQETTAGISNCLLAAMDAVQMGFIKNTFDVVTCIQNGISAFHVDQKQLLKESIRVTKPGGIILFSSYSDKFWNHRLEWFQMQADAGLLGEIDYEKTGSGVIICKDGFKATTVTPDRFLALTSDLRVEVDIVEVDESSLFCEIIP
jgi:2-polyprenyl-6-hydroxyphenyl methylase/3-demethylubiquinone-9 3-methyltransferase